MRFATFPFRAIARIAFFGSFVVLCWLPPTAVAGPTTLAPGDTSAGSDATPRTMEFIVTRNGDLNYDATFDYHTVDGTAAAGTDYTAVSGTIRMPAGMANVAIPVVIAANTGNSPDQTFGLIVENSTGLGPALVQHAPFPITNQKCVPFGFGDFYGNGLPELVANCAGTGTNPSYVKIFRNRTSPLGGPAYDDPGTNMFTGHGFGRAILGADINGDGKRDLLVADVSGSTLDVSLNTTSASDQLLSNATFAPEQTFPALDFLSTADIAVADLNGDGKPDVVVASGGQAGILFNTTTAGGSAASFAPVQVLSTALGAAAIRVADINGDGKPDLVLGAFGAATVLINTIAPGAAAASFVETDLADFSPDIGVADFNGDGLPDLITSNCVVALNTTPPGATVATFAGPQTVCNVIDGSTMFATDLTGDGRPDMVIGTQDGILLTEVTNTTPRGSMSVRTDPAITFAATNSSQISNGIVFQVKQADVNGSGEPGFVVSVLGSNEDEMDVFDSRYVATATAPALTTPQSFATGSGPGSMTSVDVNGDSRADLIVANAIGHSVSVLLDNTPPGAATASYANAQDFPAGDGTSVASVDVNADGLPDLIVTDSGNNNVAVLLNTTVPGATTQTFAPAQTFATGATPIAAAAHDLNGDGKPDLVVANSADGTVSVLFNTTAPGSATVTFSAQSPFATGANPSAVVISDVNHDFVADVIVTDSGGNNIAVLLNTTVAGAVSPAFVAAQNFSAGNGPVSLLANDLNGDGIPEVVVANPADNAITVLRNTTAIGSTTASFASATYAVGQTPSSVAAAQIGADGLFGLVVTNAGDNTLSLLVNTSDPQHMAFGTAQPLSVGAAPSAIAITDANADGKSDIAVANRNGNSVSVLLNAMYQTSVSGPATGTIVHDYIFADGFE